jgi:hypothetical protein
MDLEQISDNDLAGLLQLFAALAAGGKNRVAHDLFTIVEREGARRHKSTKIAEYQDNEIVETVTVLTSFVDDMRAKGAPDNHRACTSCWRISTLIERHSGAAWLTCNETRLRFSSLAQTTRAQAIGKPRV